MNIICSNCGSEDVMSGEPSLNDDGTASYTNTCLDCGEVKEILVQMQCGSCENIFDTIDGNDNCPYCGSSNWVFGYLDFSDEKEK